MVPSHKKVNGNQKLLDLQAPSLPSRDLWTPNRKLFHNPYLTRTKLSWYGRPLNSDSTFNVNLVPVVC